ncbi:unnamed protein product [Meganyctiphanes norvegica]|uniref:Uncharacterized protein n=1 Tax=Meganyctiphanes norvegica TaxID=48144 RepID=A0AAV2Q1F4_MEGNR
MVKAIPNISSLVGALTTTPRNACYLPSDGSQTQQPQNDSEAPAEVFPLVDTCQLPPPKKVENYKIKKCHISNNIFKIIGLMIALAYIIHLFMIIAGIIMVLNCENTRIPFYLLISGCISLLQTFITTIHLYFSLRKIWKVKIFRGIPFLVVLVAMLLIWVVLIATITLYPELEHPHNPKRDTKCSKVLNQVVYWVPASSVIALSLAVLTLYILVFHKNHWKIGDVCFPDLVIFK